MPVDGHSIRRQSMAWTYPCPSVWIRGSKKGASAEGVRILNSSRGLAPSWIQPHDLTVLHHPHLGPVHPGHAAGFLGGTLQRTRDRGDVVVRLGLGALGNTPKLRAHPYPLLHPLLPQHLLHRLHHRDVIDAALAVELRLRAVLDE